MRRGADSFHGETNFLFLSLILVTNETPGSGEMIAPWLLHLYRHGFPVEDLCVITGLSERAVVSGLVEASRPIAGAMEIAASYNGSLAVQWGWVFLRA